MKPAPRSIAKPTATNKPTSSKGDLRCACCGKYFFRDQTEVMPFCSRRCQQIDLGMWLNESYGLPYERDEMDPRRPVDDEEIEE
ncbi:MAG: DNA gyrase inhibitor YacG [Planctomycetota bacterium]